MWLGGEEPAVRYDEPSVRSEVFLPDDLFANAHQRRSLLACLLNSYKGLRENVGR